MRLFTIGFTKKDACSFFTSLNTAKVRRVIDVRLNNVSQLAGFSKREDLCYFLKAICGIDYLHLLDLAPTQEMLDQYKKVSRDWKAYEASFRSLIKARNIEDKLDKQLFDGSCLLCSEHEPEHCHRRIVAEYLRDHWESVEIVHL